MRGLDEDQVEASYGTPTINSAAGWGFNAIGVDSTSAFSGRAGYSSAVSGTGWNQGSFVGHVGIGFRFVQAIEIVTSGAGTITFTGRRRPSSIQSGLFATVHA